MLETRHGEVNQMQLRRELRRRSAALISYQRSNSGYELLTTSFSSPRHMRATGQSSASPSHFPTHGERSVYVLTVAERMWEEILNQTPIPGGDLNSRSFGWQSRTSDAVEEEKRRLIGCLYWECSTPQVNVKPCRESLIISFSPVKLSTLNQMLITASWF